MQVPFFRLDINQAEIDEVADSLRNGWLTTGPKVKKFEEAFAKAVGSKHAIAVNSCTAALHIALEAIGLHRGELVLVPALTFAATAEVVRYFDAIPVFVDCDRSFNIDPVKLQATIDDIRAGKPVAGLQPPYGELKAIIPMHYGGFCCDMEAIMKIADKEHLVVIEDAAHAYPSSYRADANGEWIHAGRFGKVGCFSFYANKCITTGEGGMAVTDDDELAERMRLMSLHGMSKDAWKRFTAAGSWYYEIVAPGFKYNLTDMAGGLGLRQMDRAEQFRARREEIAHQYTAAFTQSDLLETPPDAPDTRMHSWHLYPLRLRLANLNIDRAAFIDELKKYEISCSVHWMPLPLNPYYVKTYGYTAGLFPVAESMWKEEISLPLFPTMRDDELAHVIQSVLAVANEHRKS